MVQRLGCNARGTVAHPRSATGQAHRRAAQVKEASKDALTISKFPTPPGPLRGQSLPSRRRRQGRKRHTRIFRWAWCRIRHSLQQIADCMLPRVTDLADARVSNERSEEHTSELQSLRHLVCRLLLEK